MRAIQIQSVGKIGAVEVPDPVLQEGEALVELKAAALNHRDVWIKLGQYAGLKFPCIPGSDGAGIVRAVGVGANPSWIGHEVIINPGFDWGPSERAQGASFSILGLPRDGTLADKVAVPASQLSPKPAHMSWEEAAALPLSGLTAWRALVSRAGMAGATGSSSRGSAGAARSSPSSSPSPRGTKSGSPRAPTKRSRGPWRSAPREASATTAKDWAADAVKATGPFDVIIDSAGGPGFASLVDAAAPGGRIAIFGATRGNAAETGDEEDLLEAALHPGLDHGQPRRLAGHERLCQPPCPQARHQRRLPVRAGARGLRPDGAGRPVRQDRRPALTCGEIGRGPAFRLGAGPFAIESRIQITMKADPRFHACIMAGGSGERFWPMSRASAPKHLLRLFSETTLLEETILRLKGVVAEKNIWILTNKSQVPLIRKAIPSFPRGQIIAEPAKRDTAPAAALATGLVRARDPHGIVALLPADALIKDTKRFGEQLTQALQVGRQGRRTSGNLFTFAVTPTYAATGFGYLELGGALAQGSGGSRLH